MKLRLTVVDTPGFGDTIDNADSHQEIIRYIDQQVGQESGLVANWEIQGAKHLDLHLTKNRSISPQVFR